MALVRARRLDLLVEVAEWAHGLTGVARLETAERPQSGPFKLTIRAGFAVGRRALVLESRNDRLLLHVPSHVAAAVPDDARAVAVPIDGRASVIVRRRSDAEELVIPTRAERHVDGALHAIVDTVEATIDPEAFASGPRARPATWDVVAQITALGLTREVRVAALQVTASHGVVLGRGPLPLGGKVRRLGLSGVLTVSRHMDHRLRRRLWHTAGRLLRHLDA